MNKILKLSQIAPIDQQKEQNFFLLNFFSEDGEHECNPSNKARKVWFSVQREIWDKASLNIK